MIEIAAILPKQVQPLKEQSMQPTFRVTTNNNSFWLGAALIILCTTSAFFAWQSGQQTAAIGFLIVLVLGFYLCSLFSVIDVTNQWITERTVMGRRTINWQEVEKIASIDQGQQLTFIGADKKLTINGPAVWYGQQREALIAFIDTQAAHYNINIEVSP